MLAFFHLFRIDDSFWLTEFAKNSHHVGYYRSSYAFVTKAHGERHTKVTPKFDFNKDSNKSPLSAVLIHCSMTLLHNQSYKKTFENIVGKGENIFTISWTQNTISIIL